MLISKEKRILESIQTLFEVKMSIQILIIFSVLFLVSCSEPEYIYYKVNNTCVTRVKKESDNYFYLGRFSKNDILPNEYYIGKFRGGIDAVFFAYLYFKNDSVEFIQGEGEIEKIGIDKRFYMRSGYTIKTSLDTTLYKANSPFDNCDFYLAVRAPYDSRNYYYCESTGSVNDRLVLKRFVDSIYVRSSFNQPIGKVFYDKSLSGYSIRKLNKNEENVCSEGTFGNVVYIDQDIESEMEVNRVNQSKVKVLYLQK